MHPEVFSPDEGPDHAVRFTGENGEVTLGLSGDDLRKLVNAGTRELAGDVEA